jgi:hypothetical protein
LVEEVDESFVDIFAEVVERSPDDNIPISRGRLDDEELE